MPNLDAFGSNNYPGTTDRPKDLLSFYLGQSGNLLDVLAQWQNQTDLHGPTAWTPSWNLQIRKLRHRKLLYFAQKQIKNSPCG
jgi:hypothetical protein